MEVVVEENEENKRRTKIVQEILSSERSYVNSLSVIVKYFLEPIRQSLHTSQKIIDEKYINPIFYNVEDIFVVNSQFVSELEIRIEGQRSDHIGDLFLKRCPDFNCYAEYGKAHHNAILTITKLEKRPQWANFLAASREEVKLDILAYLIMPVQRIPRYKLLLDDLVRHTSADHPDLPHLNNALKSIGNIAMSVNESIRKQEDIQRVIEIQKSFVGNVKLATGDRMWVHQGFLMKVCRKVTKQRYFVLFNDVLVYASVIQAGQTSQNQTEGLYSFHRMLALKNVSRVKDLKDRPDALNGFQIISSEKSFTVYAETPQEKTVWMTKINNLIHGGKTGVGDQQSNHNLETEEAPVWVPDNDTKRCMICGDFFNLINRRHHCRNCGKVVCGTCSPHKKMIHHQDNEKNLRICLFCFDYMAITEKQKEKDNTDTIPTANTNINSTNTNNADGNPHKLTRAHTVGKLEGYTQRIPLPGFGTLKRLTPTQSKTELSPTTESVKTELPPPALGPAKTELSPNASAPAKIELPPPALGPAKTEPPPTPLGPSAASPVVINSPRKKPPPPNKPLPNPYLNPNPVVTPVSNTPQVPPVKQHPQQPLPRPPSQQQLQQRQNIPLKIPDNQQNGKTNTAEQPPLPYLPSRPRRSISSAPIPLLRNPPSTPTESKKEKVYSNSSLNLGPPSSTNNNNATHLPPHRKLPPRPPHSKAKVTKSSSEAALTSSNFVK